MVRARTGEHHRTRWAFVSAVVVALVALTAGRSSAAPGLDPADAGEPTLGGPAGSPDVHAEYVALAEETQALLRLRVRAVALPTPADIAIAGARSQLGVSYVYASASPGHGFDCSGLVMWAWDRAGVDLPHNSTDIYLALPHVPRDQLRPGDILYFHSPTDHVAIYLGHGMMIHAPHTGLSVEIIPVYWQYFVGGARPGMASAH